MPDIYIGSEEALTHYGVKGMKWGVRKDERILNKLIGRSNEYSKDRSVRKAEKASDKQAWSNFKRSTTSKERRELKRKAIQERATDILNQASKNPELLYAIVTPGSSYPTVATGREFVEYAARGGVFDGRYSGLWEYQLADGGGK